MADMIENRNETINLIAAVMRDVRDITGDIENQV